MADTRIEREASTKNNNNNNNNNGGGEVKEVMKVIMVVLTVVMLGYLIIWIVMPTNLYKNNWKTKMSATLTSTYFGTQGTYFYFIYLCCM